MEAAPVSPGTLRIISSPQDGGGSVAPGLDVRHRRQQGNAAEAQAASCREVGRPSKAGSAMAKKPPSLPLAREQVTDEIADMADLDFVRRPCPRRRDPRAEPPAKPSPISILAGPVAFEIGLPAAQDIDHRISSSVSGDDDARPGRLGVGASTWAPRLSMTARRLIVALSRLRARSGRAASSGRPDARYGRWRREPRRCGRSAVRAPPAPGRPTSGPRRPPCPAQP